MKFVLKHDKNRCHIVAGRSLLSGFEFDVKHLAVSIKEFLANYRSVQADILIGKKVQTFKDLYDSVKTISLCRNKLFYTNAASIILYDDIKNDRFCKIYDDNKAVIKILSAFRKNDMGKLEQDLGSLTAHFTSLNVVPEIV